MPVTRSRTYLSDIGGLEDSNNTTGFLFGDEDSNSGENRTTPTNNPDSFPALLRQQAYSSLVSPLPNFTQASLPLLPPLPRRPHKPESRRSRVSRSECLLPLSGFLFILAIRISVYPSSFFLNAPQSPTQARTCLILPCWGDYACIWLPSQLAVHRFADSDCAAFQHFLDRSRPCPVSALGSRERLNKRLEQHQQASISAKHV